MRKRPHIIIFNPDEMRWDTMGHMGNAAAYTPFLDKFAKYEGVSFSNAFCQNPVCVPSRCSFFTGLYPHVNGHRTMSYLLHPGEDNLFSELKAAGYHIWMNARNDLYAGQISGWAESNADTIFYGGDVPAPPGAVNKSKMESPYSHFEGLLGLDENGKNYTSDDETVDAAITYAKEYDKEEPLCMFLGLMYPHVPYQIEEPFYSKIDRNKVHKRIRLEECTGKSRMLRALAKYEQLQDYTEEQWRELQAVYLGMCAKVDEMFQHFCNGLKEAGIYDDCAIFFLSDHGDFAGDYGVTEKAQNCFEDCLTRVPLLVKPPKGDKVDPGTTDAMVELVDFYRTTLDYAEVELRRKQFGVSLRSIVEDRSNKIRDFVCSEGGRLEGEYQCDEYHSCGPQGPDVKFPYWPKMMAQTDDDAHAKATMIRTQRYKYISRITGEDEFYDMIQDSEERHNLFHEPEVKEEIQKLQYELLKWLQRTSDVVPFAYDQRFTEEMLWNKVKNMCPADHEDEVKEKIKGGIKQGALFLYLESLR